MKRRVLSMILTIVMVCSLLPVTAYAATTISNVSITALEAPVAGARPDYALITGTGYGVTNKFDEAEKKVSGVSWYNATDKKYMSATDTFEQGKVYEVAVALQAADGYEFSASDNYTCTTTATVNGNSAGKGKIISGYRAQEIITVNYTFAACDYARIDQVAVTGIDVPVVGETPDTTAEVDGDAKYQLITNGITWYDVTNSSEGTMLTGGATFEANHIYAVDVCFKVKDNAVYRFKLDNMECPDVIGTVNGFAAENKSGQADTVATIRYTFVANNAEIATVAVADIDEPIAGQKADFTAALGATGYRFATGYDYPYGVEWVDNTIGASLSENDTFIGGHSYEVYVRVVLNDGYTASGSLTGSLNGEAISPSKTTISGTTVIMLMKEYTCSGVVSNIDITIPEPVAGDKPNFTKIEGEGYYSEGANSPYKNGIKWYDEMTNSHLVSGTTGTFIEGNKYTVTINLRADEHFEIMDNATAKVNGKTATVYVNEGQYATVTYTFTALHKCNSTLVAKVDATCTTAGKQAYYHCDGCDKDYEDEAGTKEISDITTWGVIKATGHTIEIQNKKDATETEAGYTGDEYCTTCKQVIKKGSEVPKLQPEPTTPATPTEPEKKLAEKGATIVDPTSKAEYVVTKSDLENGTVAFTKAKDKKIKSVKIPDTVTIDGITYKVTSIAKNAFNGCSKLTSVTIGKNVTSIGDKAFYKCTKLTKITIPSKVNKIGKSAFEGCKKLKTIKIKTTKLTSKKVGSKAFKGTPKNAKVTVPKKSLKSYKKFLYKKGLNKKAKIKLVM